MSNEVEIVVTSKDNTGKGFQSADRGASKLGGTLGKMGDIAGKAGVGIGKMGGVVGIGLGVVGGAVIGAGLKITDMAGKLELMGKKSAIVFGDQLTSVQAWADKSAHSMGLTKREAVGLAGGFADLLIPMGFTRKAAADMATSTVGLSGALAEWSGGALSAAEVSDVLSAAFLGERDGLQQLGISISQAEVDAELLAKGQQNLTGKALQQAEALATQKLIMEKSTDAQKAFADGAGSLARKTQESKARMREMGDTLLTAATPALIAIGDAVQKKVLPVMEKFVAWIAGPGKYAIADWALTGAEYVLQFADQFLAGLETITEFVGRWGKNLLRGMAITLAPFNAGLAKSMWDASSKVEGFSKSTLDSLGKARAGIKTAEGAIANAKLVTKLTATKADLDTKLQAAKLQLQDKTLTATKRAEITANIANLQRNINNAQTKINSLKGKTVVTNIVMRYSSTGVNLTAPSRVGGTWGGGSIRGFAGGGNPPSGKSWVGEEGPELLDLSGGVARVTPTGNSRRQAQSGGDQPVIISFGNLSADPIGRALMEWLQKNIKIQGGNVQAVLGS